MTPDAELLARWRAGDHGAFADLYARHSRPLYIYLLSLVGEPATAEDLLQDTFVRVLRLDGDGRGALRPYLAAIARSRAIDWLRRRRRDRAALDGASRARLLAEREGSPADLTAAEASDLLWRLPPEQREVVILRIYGGYTFQEIADITGAPINTAISRHRYGLEKLRETFEEVDRDAPTKP